MVSALIVLICSLVLGYAHLSVCFGFPYLHLLIDAGNLVRLFNAVVLKWAIVFCIAGLLLSIYSLIIGKNKENKSKISWGYTMLYLLMVLLSII